MSASMYRKDIESNDIQNTEMEFVLYRACTVSISVDVNKSVKMGRYSTQEQRIIASSIPPPF